MIKKDAKLSIRCIPIECIQVKEYQERYPDKLNVYIDLLRKHPEDDPGLLHVVPSDTHADMYAILDGHHRFCAAIMAGRKDVLCVVEE